MHELTDARPGGIFTKRFWTEPRPRTGTSRAALASWLVEGVCGVVYALAMCAVSAGIIAFFLFMQWKLAVAFIA